MAILASLAALLSLVSLAQCHMAFIRLSHNGVWQPPLRFIRNRTAPWEENIPNGHREWNFPTFPSDSATSVRCGRDSLTWAKDTSTLKVKVGDTIEFAGATSPPRDWNEKILREWNNCPDGRGTCSADSPDFFGIVHNGPAVLHVSRVPDGQDLHTYDGSGEWLKVRTYGLLGEFVEGVENYKWQPRLGARLSYTIPKHLPAGQYLLRIDQIWPATQNDEAQHYPGCAHIEVENDIIGQLPAGVKIPEVLSADSPGMVYAVDFIGPLKGNRYPGGPLWDGEKLVEDRINPIGE